jgi:hypothetical protein
VLQKFKPGCAVKKLRAAEQRYMNRLCTYSEAKGFNITPAVFTGNCPAQRAYRERRAQINRENAAWQKQWRETLNENSQEGKQ